MIKNIRSKTQWKADMSNLFYNDNYTIKYQVCETYVIKENYM